MSLRENPLLVPLALIATLFAIIAFGAGDVTIFGESVSEYKSAVVWAMPLVLGYTYMLSDRELGKLSSIETASVVVPVVAIVAMQFVPAVDTIVMDYAPYSQVLLVIMVAGSFMVLME